MPDVAREAAQLCPSVTIVQIPNAGHSIRRDQYALYLEVVKAFLDAVVRDSEG